MDEKVAKEETSHIATSNYTAPEHDQKFIDVINNINNQTNRAYKETNLSDNEMKNSYNEIIDDNENFLNAKDALDTRSFDIKENLCETGVANSIIEEHESQITSQVQNCQNIASIQKDLKAQRYSSDGNLEQDFYKFTSNHTWNGSYYSRALNSDEVQFFNIGKRNYGNENEVDRCKDQTAYNTCSIQKVKRSNSW